ncbi:MAG: hypothetical protein WC654_06495 [Patescibacteria group bacterium]
MQDSFRFTRRWFGFFFLFFVVWYPISFVLVTVYQMAGQPVLYVALNVFTPLLALLMSYLYFRKAPNHWSSRLVTAFGWMFLMFVLSVLLVRPVYGFDWTSIVNWNVVNANWINIVAILVGGLAAYKRPVA